MKSLSGHHIPPTRAPQPPEPPQWCRLGVQVTNSSKVSPESKLLGAPGLTTRSKDATKNKGIATSNKKLLVAHASPGIVTARAAWPLQLALGLLFATGDS